MILCRNASFSYDGNTVLSGLNFEVRKGDCLSIVGENGSGKSTLIKGLLGLKRADSGFVRRGVGVAPADIGYLPQQTAAQKDFPASAREVVLSGRSGRLGLRPFYSREDKAAADEYMSRLSVTDLRDKCFRELSTGQQRRVLLARALCAAQKMLLLDEPAAGLDPVATQELYREISAVNERLGVTVIVVSHDVFGAVEHSSHILHLRNRQLFFGTVDEYKRSETAKPFLTPR